MKAAALILCGAVLAANAWHIAAQAVPPTFDDAWYLETSFRVFHAFQDGPAAGLQAYAHALRVKAPLISVLPLPLYAVFGTGERVALWINEIALGLTLLFVFLIGRRLYGERAGSCAAVAAGLTPLLYGLSRVYLVECVLTALVSASVWAVIAARADDGKRAWLRGALLGTGLLGKSIFPLYILGPVWLRRRTLASTAKTSLAVGLGLAATWYAFNAPYVVGFGLSAGWGSIARHYGAGWLDYAASVGRDVLSWPGLAAAAALCALAWRRFGLRGWGASERLLATWFFVPAAVFLLGVNKDVRYLAPALPAAAVAWGAAAAAWADSRLRAACLAALLLAPGWTFCSQTFGLPAAAPLAYNGPPRTGPFWDRQGLLEAIAPFSRPESVVAVGIEHPLFNANNLSCLAASRGRGLIFVSLGYAQSSVEGALIRLKDKGASLLVTVRGVPKEELPEFLNRPNAALQMRLDAGRLPARHLRSVSLRPGVVAEIYALPRA